MRSPAVDLTGIVWKKSSYSNPDGGNCVEVADRLWRKSSYSNPDGGECLEVADGFTGIMPVRDSKRPESPALFIPAPGWSSFVTAVKTDTLA
ncbi:DUF397 domain-containing protein [Streptomyces sp. DSM 44917]|uniref:DUF397 domain-containing protein n=1 Tax=Streptomyces boetiae TaxID=3075541 RepID=A0ABU2LAM6_9ACTN|nr:DUF397 domain-containing protein [Streptomyces sp. DSM 44917]MDT0308615.1 DUF397 domain-containing protein [Streptomyces sp. DSM 44917]